MNKTLAVALIALVVSVGSFVFPRTTDRVTLEPLAGVRNMGGTASFAEGIIVGSVSYGKRYATTTAASSKFSAQELCNNGLIYLTPAAVGSKTISVASSTDMFNTCIPEAGDSRTVLVYHATTASGNDITWADTGSNTNHTEEESATTVLSHNEQAYLTFTNVNGSEMLFDVSIRQVAD